jgi:hypothetical protein
MPRIRRLWAAVLIAVVLALPTTAALAADQSSASPQHPQYFICQYTYETDNIQVNGSRNPFWDDLGNEWIVYYDTTRDVHNDQLCDVRVDVRIFNPAPDGSWRGTVDVLAYVNGAYDSYSYQKVNGSGTAQAHYVWRGPWFGGSTGSYQIESNEFNGSTVYARAYTNFTL